MAIQVNTGQRSALEAMIALQAQVLNADEAKRDAKLARVVKTQELLQQNQLMTNINLQVAKSVKSSSSDDLVKAAQDRAHRDSTFLESLIKDALK